MIIFLNGTFGSGKTTIAELLAKELRNAHIFDPEEVGFFLRNVLGKIDPKDDFQQYPQWRSMTVETVRLLRRDYGRDLIIPMTVWRREFFDEIMTGLKDIEPRLHHFTLMASRETIRKRLNQRGDTTDAIGYVQAEESIPALSSPAFATHIDTEANTPEETVKIILAAIAS